MKLWNSIFLTFLFSLLLAGTATAQWIVVEDFESGLPAWDSTRDGGGFAWGISVDPEDSSNDVLNHDLIDNGALYGKNYVACKIYAVTQETMLGVRIRNRGNIANGVGTMACVVRAGVHTAEDIYNDYLVDGLFTDWAVVAQSREAPHTVGNWNNTWQVSSVFIDTGAFQSVTVGFVAVAAIGSSPETWFDDLQFLELPGPETGVDEWEIYR